MKTCRFLPFRIVTAARNERKNSRACRQIRQTVAKPPTQSAETTREFIDEQLASARLTRHIGKTAAASDDAQNVDGFAGIRQG